MCTTIWDPGSWAWALSFARTGTKTNSGWASALPSSRPEIICRSNSFDVRKGHGFLRGFFRKLFPFSEDSRFENGFCPVRGVVPERERYVAGRQEAESHAVGRMESGLFPACRTGRKEEKERSRCRACAGTLACIPAGKRGKCQGMEQAAAENRPASCTNNHK